MEEAAVSKVTMMTSVSICEIACDFTIVCYGVLVEGFEFSVTFCLCWCGFDLIHWRSHMERGRAIIWEKVALDVKWALQTAGKSLRLDCTLIDKQ